MFYCTLIVAHVAEHTHIVLQSTVSGKRGGNSENFANDKEFATNTIAAALYSALELVSGCLCAVIGKGEQL